MTKLQSLIGAAEAHGVVRLSWTHDLKAKTWTCRASSDPALDESVVYEGLGSTCLEALGEVVRFLNVIADPCVESDPFPSGHPYRRTA